MLIDFHTHLDFYKREELQKQLTEFSGTIITASVDEKSFLENYAIAEWAKSPPAPATSSQPSAFTPIAPTKTSPSSPSEPAATHTAGLLGMSRPKLEKIIEENLIL